MPFRDLVTRFIGDDRDLHRAFTASEKRATVFQSRMSRLNQGLRGGLTGGGVGLGSALLFGSGTFVGAAAVTKTIDESIQAASDLNEQIARSNQVFEDNAASVQKWSKSLASSFGIAQAQGLEFAGTFGLLFTNLGVSTDQAETFSRQLVELAADLASFNNTDVDTALNALRSGLTGEIEPLRKFGVFLSEARSNTEALATSGKKSSKELTTQEKVLARFNIILQDTGKAQGDFARTSDGLANKQRIARAETTNLAASLGQALAPAMDVALISTIALVGGINDLIAGMGDLRTSLRDSNFFDGFNAAVEEANSHAVGFFENLRDNIPLLNEVARLREGVIGGGTSFAIPDRPEEGRGALEAAAGRANQIEKDAKQAERDLKRARNAFDEFAKGLGLKFDKARLTSDTSDDLAALRELERAINKRIAAEGKTFKLVNQLTQVRLQINSIVQQNADDARQAGLDAFDATLDALDLDLEIAQATKSFSDDQAVLRAIEQAILERIESEGKTTDLLRQLFQVRQQQAEVARQVREQQAQRRQESQFEALGLTAEGDQKTPGAGALLRRAQSLQDQIAGTVLDTKKNRQALDNIVRLLKTQFKNVGRDVRRAIQEMLNEISSGFDNAENKISGGTGEITKGGIRSTQRLLRGLDLTDEERRIIQQRNLGVSGRRGFSAFGVGIGTPSRSTGSIDRRVEGEGGIFIQNLTVVTNDPNDLMKKLQKKARRSSGGRRGRHGGANLGMQ